MIDFLVKRNSYEKMPGFTVLLDIEKIKVIIKFSNYLIISVKNSDINLFKELARKNGIDLMLK